METLPAILNDAVGNSKNQSSAISNYQVTKSNKVIEARYKLSTREQKFILYMASLIQPQEEEFKFYEISINKIGQLFNHSGAKWGRIYGEIRELVRGLNRKELVIKLENGDEQIINWVSSVEIRVSGIISFEFSERLKPYLLQLKKGFTTYKLMNIIRLKSAYSIRLYELLKQYEKLKKRTLNVDDLKRRLGIGDEYKQYGHFKKRVILYAQKELKEKTDIQFEFEEKKHWNKVVEIEFRIYPNKIKVEEDNLEKLIYKKDENNLFTIAQDENNSDNSDKQNGQAIKTFDSSSHKEVFEKLLEFGISERDAKEYLQKYDIEYIKDNLKEVEKRFKAGRVANLTGYAIMALNKDYRKKISKKEKDRNENFAKHQKEKSKEELEQIARQAEKEREFLKARKQCNKMFNNLPQKEQKILMEAVLKEVKKMPFVSAERIDGLRNGTKIEELGPMDQAAIYTERDKILRKKYASSLSN